VTGNTKVIIHGRHLDYSLGGIYCRFGATIVSARIIKQGESIVCYTPESDAGATSVDLALSLNNRENFHVKATFRYLPTDFDIRAVEPVAQDYLAVRTVSVRAAADLPFDRTKVAFCKFMFTDKVDYVTIGRVVSPDLVFCDAREHFNYDEAAKLALSFNGQQYHTPATTLKFFNDDRRRFNMTQFTEARYGDILAL
jgi:hypothetical protein